MMQGRRLLLVAVLAGQIVHAETPGKDGDANITTAGVVANQYAQVSGSPPAGSSTLTAVALATAMPTLGPGDLIMIYQAQGATIDGSNAASYGAVTAYNNAGRYEFQTVASVAGNIISFATYGGACSGLKYAYSAAGNPQIVRVAQLRNVSIAAGASVIAQPWNGVTGGVVVATIAGTFTNNGTISATGAGFRGGALDNNAALPGDASYYTADSNFGAEKGEGIAGYQATLPGGTYGRGAPANGGGGGNAHNAGGGGGANGDNGNGWAGQGKPDLSGTGWSTAWNLDPSLNASTNNAGGGRGGYSFAFSNQNALTLAPGNSAWTGDSRREVGGLGGRPLTFDRTGRIFFGGGGGAGDANNLAGSAGGRGGGIVFIAAGTASGSGTIAANGISALDTISGNNDAPGGGGGGGTIIMTASSAGSIAFLADGGRGGSQLITNDESEGPGGGGGGGIIAVSGGALSAFARGGGNGLSSSNAITEFTPNGATQGATGQASATAPSRAETPLCYAPPPSIAKTSTPFATSGIDRFNTPTADVLYTIAVSNPGTQIDNGAVMVTDTLPAEITFYNGDIDDAGPLTGPFQFIDGSPTSTLTCCTGGQVAYSQFTTGTDFSYVPVAGYDANVKRIRFTPTGAMAAGSTVATNFQIKLRARIK